MTGPVSLKSISEMLTVLLRFKIAKEATDCLFGSAVLFERGDNAEKYKNAVPGNAKHIGSATENAEPLISLDVNSSGFKADALALVKLLWEVRVMTWSCSRQFTFSSKSS